MWELRNNNGTRKFEQPKSTDSRRCPICGRYICPGDYYYIVVCLAIPEATALKLQNQIVHTDCWEEFCKDIGSDAELAAKLKKHRTPKAPPLTPNQNNLVNTFRNVAIRRGYGVKVLSTTNLVVASEHEGSGRVEFNPYTERLQYTDRRKKGLFGWAFDREIETKFFNEMHELLGDRKHDDFSATGAIGECFAEAKKQADEIIGNNN